MICCENICDRTTYGSRKSYGTWIPYGVPEDPPDPGRGEFEVKVISGRVSANLIDGSYVETVTDAGLLSETSRVAVSLVSGRYRDLVQSAGTLEDFGRVSASLVGGEYYRTVTSVPTNTEASTVGVTLISGSYDEA